MNQRTHAWIAIRALRLIEDEGGAPQMINLLKPFVQQASIGAWIPDMRETKSGGATTQNHIFKMGPFNGQNKSRFVLEKQKLVKRLGPKRKVTDFINKYDHILDSAWWSTPFKAEPSPGKHLANRAMALAINNIDMLILGDAQVQTFIPGRVGFIDKIPPATRCSGGQVALFFFMLSHFIADALMPCHCDERDLADYDNGLHKELESHWSKKIGTAFDADKLLALGQSDAAIMDSAAAIDVKFELQFDNGIPEMVSDDVWEEIVILCRASFAVASVMAPPTLYAYKPKAQIMAPFDLLFTRDPQGKELLLELDRVLMHDAVLNVAIIWKHIWNILS